MPRTILFEMASLAANLSQSGTMWSVFSLAPYAIGITFFAFAYFVILPYIEYLRDPKGMSLCIRNTMKEIVDGVY